MTREEYESEQQTKELSAKKRLYAESVVVDPDNDNNLIYTGKNVHTVARKDLVYPKMRGYAYEYARGPVFMNYGFLRAIADKSGNILAYARALKIEPNIIPNSITRLGTWYAFEEYNINLLKNFKLEIFGHITDIHSANWTYDAERRIYTLTIPGRFDKQMHCFAVNDDSITSDCSDTDLTYGYQVKQTEPSKYIIRGVRAALHRNGILEGPVPLRDNFFPWMVGAEEITK